MVSDPRKTTSFSRLRAINQPKYIKVKADQNNQPIAILIRNNWRKVTKINDFWEITDEWWGDFPISRKYYSLTISNDIRISIFIDLINGFWYQQKTHI